MSGDINVSLHTCGVKCYEQCMVEIKLLRWAYREISPTLMCCVECLQHRLKMLSLSLSLCLQVPSPPGDEDEDFILVHHSDVQISEKAEEVYTQLAKILKEQHEVKPQQSLYKKFFLKFNGIKFFFGQILQIICDFK